MYFLERASQGCAFVGQMIGYDCSSYMILLIYVYVMVQVVDLSLPLTLLQTSPGFYASAVQVF